MRVITFVAPAFLLVTACGGADRHAVTVADDGRTRTVVRVIAPGEPESRPSREYGREALRPGEELQPHHSVADMAGVYLGLRRTQALLNAGLGERPTDVRLIIECDAEVAGEAVAAFVRRQAARNFALVSSCCRLAKVRLD